VKYFLTGATGFIGQEIAKKLLADGATLHLLIRSSEKMGNLMDENLKMFRGDITDLRAIEEAIAGCDFAIHLAAYARPWSKDKELPYRINVEGTRNVLEAALKANVRRVVYTSTAGVFRPSDQDEAIDENSPLPDSYLTEYERTKGEAEKLCLQFADKGLDVVIVNPTRVYGPGKLSKSNSLTVIIEKCREGRWHIMPGSGGSVGNYVFISDVVSGHLLALSKGKPGEKYILGGTNTDFKGFFEVLAKETGHELRLVKLPRWIMLPAACLMVFFARVFGAEPMITPGFVKRYDQNRVLSSGKAVRELGYSITPLNEGIAKTLMWLENKRSEPGG
jgi:farnesol dehydrogenase